LGPPPPAFPPPAAAPPARPRESTEPPPPAFFWERRPPAGMPARRRRSDLCQAVEFGGVVVRELLAHLGREVAHLPFDRGARIGPHAVGMRIGPCPQKMALAAERDQRHR